MCCLAKIYTDNTSFKTYEMIKVDSTELFTEDNSVPTLIIGKKNAEKIFGKENIKVLNKQIKNNIFWTYSKYEKRSEFEKDIEKFYEYVFNGALKNIKYVSINVYTLTYEKAKKTINFLNNKNSNKTALITENHVYIHYGNNIYGVSLDELNYIGVKKDKFISFLKKCNVTVITNYNILNDILKKYYNFSKTIAPYLLSLVKEC